MISVLMAVKTSAQYMLSAIGSVLGQTFPHWELIIGINGLGYESQLYREARRIKHGLNDKEARRIHPMNLPECTNKAAALNVMVQHAGGAWIALLDCDDLWHPYKLEKQVAFMNEHPQHDVIATLAQRFGTDRQIIGKAGPITLPDLLAGNCIVNSSAMLRRDLAQWYADADGRLEDYELWLRLASQNRCLACLDKVLTYSRCHPDQWGLTGNSAAIEALQNKYHDPQTA